MVLEAVACLFNESDYKLMIIQIGFINRLAKFDSTKISEA
jgi:hypothetical protein